MTNDAMGIFSALLILMVLAVAVYMMMGAGVGLLKA
jgi:hypothetical protein